MNAPKPFHATRQITVQGTWYCARYQIVGRRRVPARYNLSATIAQHVPFSVAYVIISVVAMVGEDTFLVGEGLPPVAIWEIPWQVNDDH